MTHWLVGEQWEKQREKKNKRGVWCGKAREQSSHRGPLSFFRSPFFTCRTPLNFARWTRNLLAVQVGALAVVTVLCSYVRNLFANLPSSGYFKMDDAKVPGQPEDNVQRHPAMDQHAI